MMCCSPEKKRDKNQMMCFQLIGYANKDQLLLSLIILSWWKQALTTARLIVNIC